MFFYGYVYGDYYECNVNGCFTYLGGYGDNTLHILAILYFILWRAHAFVRMVNPRQHCWVVEVQDHEDVGKERDIKD